MKPVRRKDRALSHDQAIALLIQGEYGVLSSVSPDGQPYGVPLNYVYRDDHIYFHCALDGHKLDNLASDNRVAFCVVGRTRVLPDQFATEYESAVVFGLAEEVLDEERHKALIWLLEKYSPGFLEQGKHYIAQKDKVTRVMKIKITHLSGKTRGLAGR